MTRKELIDHLQHLEKYTHYSEDAPALREVIEMLTETHEERTETHACDLIDRQAAIDALRYTQHRFTVADEAGGIGTVKWSENVIYFAAAEKVLADLPSARPDLDEWCTDCKEYDQERHSCPRWNRVIRETLKDAQPLPYQGERQEE